MMDSGKKQSRGRYNKFNRRAD